MKIFANKSIWKKIVIILICITIFSFVSPKPVAASIGGALMEPICNLLVTIADGVVWAIQKFAISQDVSFINIDLTTGLLSRIIGIVLTIVGIAAVIAASFLFGGLGFIGLVVGNLLTLLGGGATIGGLILATGTVSLSDVIDSASDLERVDYTIATQLYEGEAFEVLDEIDLPLIAMSPEEIFTNEIPLFDVNFFDPSEETYTSRYGFVTTMRSDSSDDVTWIKYIKYTFYFSQNNAGSYNYLDSSVEVWYDESTAMYNYRDEDGEIKHAIKVDFTVQYGKRTTDEGYEYYKQVQFSVNGVSYSCEGSSR